MRSHVLLIALCLSCNDKKSAGVFGDTTNEPTAGTTSTAAPSAATAAAPISIPKGVDWPARKRVAHDVDVEGLAVTLDVPEGLPRDPRSGDWNITSSEADELPKVVLTKLEADRIPDVDKAKYNATLSARSKTWVRTDERPDGWALTNAEPDKTHIEAIRYLRSGDHFVRCKASMLSETPIPSHGKALTMLESICDSMKVR